MWEPSLMEESQTSLLGAPPVVEMGTQGQNGVVSLRKRRTESTPRLMEETWCPVLTMVVKRASSLMAETRPGPQGPSPSLEADPASIVGVWDPISSWPPAGRCLPGGQAEPRRLQPHHAHRPGHPEDPRWYPDHPTALPAWRRQCQSQPGIGPWRWRPGQPFPLMTS